MFINTPSLKELSLNCVQPLTHPFCLPQHKIQQAEDMEIWLRSEAYWDFIGFIVNINTQVQGFSLNVICFESDFVKGLVRLLQKWESWIEEHIWFKVWKQIVGESCLDSLQMILPAKYYRAVPEIQEYLLGSFGSTLRNDYGPGHEMHFCMFLYCLYRIGVVTDSDCLALVNKVFNRYLHLVRQLQVKYKLAPGPAGGRGYWTLDDHQFVAFIWGSSQLINHPKIQPRSYLQPDMLEAYGDEYIFLGSISHINQLKPGLFSEHSCQLWNLSAVGYWETINKGLLRTYKEEVLGKFKVIQHILFGSLWTLTPSPMPQINLTLREITMTFKKADEETQSQSLKENCSEIIYC